MMRIELSGNGGEALGADLLQLVGAWLVDGRHCSKQPDEVIQHVGLARIHDAHVLADLINKHFSPLDGVTKP